MLEHAHLRMHTRILQRPLLAKGKRRDAEMSRRRFNDVIFYVVKNPVVQAILVLLQHFIGTPNQKAFFL